MIFMAKQRKGGATTPSKRNIRLWQGILALVVVAGLVSARVLRNQGSSASAGKATSEQMPDSIANAPLMRNHLALPASPRNPRPVTLDPNNYTEPEVRAAYQAARDVPEVLEQMACYCGCYKEAGHRNNLDCYHDKHGVT